jgi:hypothetical protein
LRCGKPGLAHHRDESLQPDGVDAGERRTVAVARSKAKCFLEDAQEPQGRPEQGPLDEVVRAQWVEHAGDHYPAGPHDPGKLPHGRVRVGVFECPGDERDIERSVGERQCLEIAHESAQPFGARGVGDAVLDHGRGLIERSNVEVVPLGLEQGMDKNTGTTSSIKQVTAR